MNAIKEAIPVPSLAYAVPILAGKTEDVRILAAEIMGPRLEEHTRTMVEKGLERETLWVQPTNRGDLLILYLEGANPWEAITRLAESQGAYDRWYKEQLGAGGVTGIDLSRPIPPDSVEPVYASHLPSEEAHQESLAFVVPLLAGKRNEWRQLVEEIKGPRAKEMEDYHRRMGITTENWYLEHTTQGDMIVVYLRTPNLPETLTKISEAREPFDRWLKERLGETQGLDYDRPFEIIPELVFDWQSQRRERAVA
ncbi:MAG: hypothetical protein C4521_10355 [Actinobacteria bacterium]|nr:MAG: hypothetical protein C4521_10355 [Actinomycetota bacterium]